MPTWNDSAQCSTHSSAPHEPLSRQTKRPGPALRTHVAGVGGAWLAVLRRRSAEVMPMKWAEFEASAPRLAQLAREKLIGPGVLLVGTVRRDGTPRISPVEPFLLDGDLWLSMLWGSHKAADLAHDPRVLLHSIVTGRDGGAGELKVRGRCQAEPGLDMQQRYAEAVSAALGWRPEVGRMHLFWVDIDTVAYLRYQDPTGDQFVVLWPQGKEFVRRGTGGTSLGPAEPSGDLLGG